MIILVDPLPAVEEKHPGPDTEIYQWDNIRNDTDSGISEVDTDSAERGEAHIVYETRSLFGANEPLLIQWGRAIKKLMEKKPVLTRNLSIDLIMNKEFSLHKVIVKQIAPRHTVSVDLDRVFQSQESTMSFERKMNSTASTLDGICDELERHSGPVSLSRLLFNIVKQDTLTLLKQLSRGLEEVEIGLVDDAKMEDRLSVWVQAIGSAQRELSGLQASMEPFILFSTSLDPLNASTNSIPQPEVLSDFEELSKSITQMSDRLQRASALLTSNMGLLDSRRSINEAQAVSRLTELAFVFVPVSFASSIFGMQVEPFADPVPLRSFFVVAVGVTTFAYFMRVTMRSQWLAYLKLVLKHDVKKYAERHNLPVPTRSIPILLAIQWIGSWLGFGIKKSIRSARRAGRKIWTVFGFFILFILLTGSVSGVLVGMLWARDLDPGTRCAVSIAIIMVVIVSVGIPFWHWSDPDFRYALPYLISRIFRRYPPRTLRLVMFSGLTVVLIMIPLVLIWMRPLATGIKSGLTVGILISVLSTMGVLMLRWINTNVLMQGLARIQ